MNKEMRAKTVLVVVFAFLSTNDSSAFSPPQQRRVTVGNNNNNAFVLRVPPLRRSTNSDYNSNTQDTIDASSVIIPNNRNDAIPIPTRKYKGLNGYSLPNGADRYHDMLDQRGLFIQRIFSPRAATTIRNEENEDGWEEMRKEKPLPMWKKMAKLPFRVYNKVVAREKTNKEPGTLILVRHGESKWNG